MPSETLRRHVYTGAILVLGPLAPFFFGSTPARAEVPRSPTLEISGASAGDRQPFKPRSAATRRGAEGPEGSGGWWLGTAGIALALAACGGISVASKRFLPARNASSPMRVIARTSLSPKHSVYLLEVGQRVLIVGTGTQGPPSLLGELTDSDGREALTTPQPPTRSGPTVSVPIRPVPGSSTARFDRRVGDDA